eukprot:7571522-Alexandrium_andersonii.AAC.1
MSASLVGSEMCIRDSTHPLRACRGPRGLLMGIELEPPRRAAAGLCEAALQCIGLSTILEAEMNSKCVWKGMFSTPLLGL